MALGARHVPESRDPAVTGKLDTPGALAAVVFLTGIAFALIEGPAFGWSSPSVLAMAAVGVAALVAFLVRERTAAAPMLPLAIFRTRQFAATNAVTFIVYAALSGATFLLPIELQVVWGYSPLGSGLALLPLTVIMLLLSARRPACCGHHHQPAASPGRGRRHAAAGIYALRPRGPAPGGSRESRADARRSARITENLAVHGNPPAVPLKFFPAERTVVRVPGQAESTARLRQ